MYYPKFHFELNYIKYFLCDRKSWTRKNCKYSIERLREDIFKALAQIKGSTILEHYKSCLKKMGLYKKNIQYRTSEWKKLISYKKTWPADDDR